MGVPALFRWLSKKYPKIVQSVEEDEPGQMTGPDGEMIEVPVDISRPNPNGEEYDCLYLDMNGIVHPCTHPEGKPAPETEEEMMAEVFQYTERVVAMIRPRKLLMMAIDGVAPRAKMNQQRSRRFRSAQDAKIMHDQREQELAERKKKGQADDDESVKKSWDSNAITPGTPFMDLLASSLRYWIAHKLNTDPGWKNLCVVLSDASVPGEGEHKIMDYIRRKRSDPNHDPNMKHVIYGLDADLIMLSLATHEPHFKVLREDVFAQDNKSRGCHRCGQEGHYAANCVAERVEKPVPAKKPFIFLDVPTLREYLAVELQTPGIPFPFDLERAIDDWVFLIFFVGNDFLPHLPSLEIREGAIDTLLKIWKRELPRMTGYVTNNGRVELRNAQLILDGLANLEDEIFRKRKETEERQEANKRRHAARDGKPRNTEASTKPVAAPPVVAPPVVAPSKPVPGARNKGPILLDGDSMDVVKNRAQIRMANISAAETMRVELAAKKGTKRAAGALDTSRKRGKVEDSALFPMDEEMPRDTATPSEDRAKALASALEGTANESDDMLKKDVLGKEALVKQEDESSEAAVKEEESPALKKEEDEEQDERGVKDDDDEDGDDDDDDEEEETSPLTRKVNDDGTVEYEDTVKLYEPGYRERYYRQKFGVELSDTAFRRAVVQKYVEGLCWVLAYYYQGCPSWKWYYPYHYAPFAADFTDMASLAIEFGESEPFRPFEQLMGVLPAASKTNLPEPFQWLMTDPESEIVDFYPSEFSIDMNGKKMAWQGVALLPFIDEKRLLTALHKRYGQLTKDEVRRNSFGRNVLFVNEDADLYPAISRMYAKRNDGQPQPIDTTRIRQIAGTMEVDPSCVPSSTFYSPLSSLPDMKDIHNDHSVSVYYDFPAQRTPHRSVLLRGLRLPPRRLTPADADWVRRGGGGGHRGGGFGGRGGRGGRRDGWSSQGALYGRDAHPGGPYHAPSNGPYGGGPYGGGPYNAGPYNAGPYNAGPYNAGPYNAGPYQPAPSGPYGGGAYAGHYANPYGGHNYQAYGYGQATNSFGASPYGHAGTAYGSAYGQPSAYGGYGQASHPYSGYGGPPPNRGGRGSHRGGAYR
ncbi:5'-3' exoribonuclease 2 [Malassezia pachydermatis]